MENGAQSFFQLVQVLRRDDHRLYHQSRINQTLHLISACVFLGLYVYVWFNPPIAAILGWFGAMCVRQAGHFFFEPLGYDSVNGLTNDQKESIKVGFNVYRKIALLAVWVAIPLVLYVDPSVSGLVPPSADAQDWLHRTGWGWLGLAASGLLARTLYLMTFRSATLGAAWLFKILSDPFHNVEIYWRSPLHLLRGQLIEPLDPVQFYNA